MSNLRFTILKKWQSFQGNQSGVGDKFRRRHKPISYHSDRTAVQQCKSKQGCNKPSVWSGTRK